LSRHPELVSGSQRCHPGLDPGSTTLIKLLNTISMQPVKSLITEEELEQLASRSNFRYGQKIAEEGDITFTKVNTFNLFADVKHHNGEKRSVEIMSTPKGLRWRCTCTSRKDLFCKHLVAVGLKAVQS
jgi:uncharacterized Zn finger protein